MAGFYLFMLRWSTFSRVAAVAMMSMPAGAIFAPTATVACRYPVVLMAIHLIYFQFR
jgi:hypothetical protein